MSKQSESRTLHIVTQPFEAYTVQSGEGFAQESFGIKAGWELFADPDYWDGKLWEGIPVVQFLHGMTRLYANRKTFLESTRPKRPAAD